MKKIMIIMFILLPAYVFAGTYDDMAKDLMKKIPKRDKKKVIAVMPFSSDKKYSSDAQLATEEMTKALIDAGAVVSERSQIDKMLKEQELQQVGVLTSEDAGEVGQGLGAKYVVLGSMVEIDKFGEKGNIGLKINVKLVVSSNYKILAASSGEVAASDASSKYKRKGPRKAAEYPQFLEIYAGATKFNYDANYSDKPSSYDDLRENDMQVGFSAGAKLVRENSGFYTSGWEFLYSREEFDDDDLNEKIEVYSISWIPTIRIPLWVYFPSLPDYTSIHLGYSFGLGISNLTYIKDMEKTKSKGFGICTSAIVGLRIGLTDSVCIFGDFRYTPARLNGFIRSQEVDNDDISVKEEITGPAAYFGISLAP